MTRALNRFMMLLAVIVVMCGQPARAHYWIAVTVPNVTPPVTCQDGTDCAIRSGQQIWGSDWTPNRCAPAYSGPNLYRIDCSNLPVGGSYGAALLFCDGNEVPSARGCIIPVGKAPPNSCDAVGDPVLAKEGVLYEHVTDVSIGQTHPLVFSRTYWSDLSSQAGPTVTMSRLGQGWRSNFDVSAFLVTNWPSTTVDAVVIIGEDGREVRFAHGQNGYYLVGSDLFNTSNTAAPGSPHQSLIKSGANWIYTDGDDTNFLFNASGQLQSKTYRDGYQQNLAWNNNQNTSVVDNLGRSISFTYDNKGDMTALTTNDGSVYSYSYLDVSYPGSSTVSANTFNAITNSNLTFVLKSVTYPGPSSPAITYQYNDIRFPMAMTGKLDERGVQISTWTYDANGRVSQNALSGGQGTFIFSYDPANNQNTVTNPLGKNTVFHYAANPAGATLLTQIQGLASSHCGAANTIFAYDSNNYVSQVVDGQGRTTVYANDASGRPTSITSGSGTAQATTTTIVWHPTLNVATRIVQPNLTTDFTWNASGQLAQVKQTDTTSQTIPFSTNGRTRTWAYTYGAGGLLTSVDGPLAGRGDTLSYTYNNQGFLQTVTDEVGHVTTVTAWNGRGQPTSVTGANGVVTTYGYDPLGRMTSATVNPGPSQTQWSFTYTPAGDLATVAEPSGAIYTLTWDDARRLTTITNNLGETIHYTRDAMGNATGKTIAAADGQTLMLQLTNSFDELGRLIKQVGGENATWSYAYDLTDLLTGITDPRSQTLGYAYDAMTRLITETERDGGVVTHGFNGKSEETSYTDPRHLPTTFVRDGFGDVIQETSPDRGTTIFDYDARGLVISRKDARGKQTTYSYDTAGRLTAVAYPATPSLNITYTYDGSAAGANGIGHVTHVQDAAGTTDFFYDAVGRVSGEQRTFGSKTYTTAYTYDQTGSGRLVFLMLPGGQLLNYGYDALGRINWIGIGSSWSGPFTPVVSNLSYFPFGPLREIDFANGVVRYENNDLEYKLDGLFLTKGSTVLVTRYHSFGDGLNLLELNNDSVDPTKTQRFGYDNAQRLTSASSSGTYGSLGWTYDLVGNRLTETRTPAGSSATTTSIFTYPSTSNLLTNVKQGATVTRAFTYDAAGNTTKDTRSNTAYTYTINDAGRIAQLTIGSTVTAKYTYDAEDRRSVRQTLDMSP